MYLTHFGLREYPFNITPDTSFFFSSGASQEALNTLLVAARMGEGFIKITGEVGTGKTLLCRKLMATLGEEFYVAYVPNPYLDPIGLFSELSTELEIPLPSSGKIDQHRLLRGVMDRLLELGREGKHVVVCLDEVQAMPIETLEALRLLTNLETEKKKLLQVIIFAQPELEAKLRHPSIRQLKQRITFHYHLGPLTSSELRYYLHHRLMIAGHHGGQIFSRAACWLIERSTHGVPRLVNIVAHKALLSAFGGGKRQVGMFDVLAAARDTDSTASSARWRSRVFVGLLLAAGCTGALTWMRLP
jgi:MSHA biogenesis protein MshM